MRARRRTAAVVAAVAVLGLSGCGTGATAAPAAPPPAYHGGQPESPTARPSFVLTGTDGERYDFAERTRGRPTLLYFGYTSCPDECPTAMADIAAAVRQAPADVRERMEVVFVTTDPDRDSPDALRRWLDGYDVRVTGLLGSAADLAAAQRAVGVRPAEKQGPIPTLPGRPDAHEHRPGSAPHSHAGPLGYAVGHADAIFGYDAADRLAVTYPGGVLPADLAADLPLLAAPDRPGEPT
jgi:protein SCO1/2